MMKRFNGKHECLNCGSSFDWESRIEIPNGVPIIQSGVQADLYGCSTVMTSQGTKLHCDVIAKCPKCGLKNKFDHVQ